MDVGSHNWSERLNLLTPQAHNCMVLVIVASGRMP